MGRSYVLDIGEKTGSGWNSVSVLVLTVKGAASVAPGKPSVYSFGPFVPFHAMFCLRK